MSLTIVSNAAFADPHQFDVAALLAGQFAVRVNRSTKPLMLVSGVRIS